ncbi:MAG: ABC transporter ATP-binding protein [Chthoniobacterales bacterium]
MAKVTLRSVSTVSRGANAGDVTAVNDLSLELNDHEFVVLAGPPASGNATTLRVIAGLEETSKGEVFIGKRRVNDLPPNDRGIGMVFQNPSLYPQMSVFENLAFALKLRKFPKPEIEKRIADAAGILGLEEMRERKPKQLSGEECLRVAIARAIVRQPELLLFEEPLSGLDAGMRAQLRTEIARLHQRLRTTTIYATHDESEAMAMAERLVVMKNGVVQQNDSPFKIYNEPMNLFVADFFGRPAMNFVKGTLKLDRDALIFHESGEGTIEARFLVADRPAASEYIGRPLLLGIRPEDIEVAHSSPEKGKSSTSFPALVDLVEAMGGETYFHLQTGAHPIVCRSRRGFHPHQAGHRLRFEIDPQKAHFFDPSSTIRI